VGLVRAKLLSCVVVAALLPVSFGCDGSGSSEEGEETALTVYAASSLTDAFGELKAPQTFARNRLTVIVPAGNPAGIASYRDLARPGITLVLAQDEVPVAEYAKESLTKANAVYGSDFSERVLSNVASREADVKAAANRVAVGDADATIVYTSDATPDLRGRVEVIEIPEELNVVASYPIALTENAQSLELAQGWVDLVLSDEGQRVMEKWGFERVG